VPRSSGPSGALLAALLAVGALTACSVASPLEGRATALTAALYVSPTGQDSNPGTREHPVRQVLEAAHRARPGSVVHVAPGTYAPVTSSTDGTPDAPIRFVSDQPGQASIRAGGAVTAWTNTAAWVVVLGFDLQGASYNGLLTTASHGRFLGNHIHDLQAPDCSRGGAGIVVESYTAVDNDSIGNRIEQIGTRSRCGLIHGIYYESPYGGRILNNVVTRTSGYGIHLWHNASHIQIINNTVVGNTQGGIAVGGSLEGNDLSPGIATGVDVSNNVLVANGGHGLSERGRVGRNTFVDNLVFGNQLGDIALLRSSAVGTVRRDPVFVGPENFRLQCGSPGIDRGTSQGAPADDVDGRARPVGGRVDLGAYEASC
jgi:parallel beta-helix repeat protein